MMRAFLAILRRDLVLAARAGGGGELGLVFFLTLVVLFPFALGPDLALLSRLAPAILWLGALLSLLIGLDRLFQPDEEDGSLLLMETSQLPLEGVVLAKALAHWLTTGLPLALAAPLLGLMLALPADAMAPLALVLTVGTPSLSFIGAGAAAVTARLRRGGVILPVIVAPLTIPILIFGVASGNAAIAGDPRWQTLGLVVCGLTLIAAVAGVLAGAAALRQPD